LNQEVLQGRSLANLQDAQKAFDPWRSVYNHQRPHHALELAVPATRYRVSERPFKEVTTEFQYSNRFEVRRLIRKQGSSDSKASGIDSVKPSSANPLA
jgi:hypothetical protein